MTTDRSIRTTRQPLSSALAAFDPDAYEQVAIALRVDVAQHDVEQPVHCHRKGQLVLTLHGGVTCEAADGMWMVPPQHAAWIPGGVPHSNRATDNARIHFLFVAPGVVAMPDRCCTLAISPLIRELVQYLADRPPTYPSDGATARVAHVLLEQLAAAPIAPLALPMPAHPRVRRIATALAADPADRTTLSGWAARLAMSDRTLARLVMKETGLTFGRWRQQLHLIVALRQLTAGATVQQVAGNLGYDSVTAFITMFRKALGKSPTQYLAALR